MAFRLVERQEPVAPPTSVSPPTPSRFKLVERAGHPTALGTFLKSAVSEVTRTMPIAALPRAVESLRAYREARQGKFERAKRMLAERRMTAQAEQAHPIAAGLGQVAGFAPSLLSAGVALKGVATAPKLLRFGATPLGRTGLRAGIGAAQFGLAEAFQGRPEAIPRSAFLGAVTGPAQAIPRLLPRVAASGLTVGAVSAATAPPGQRKQAAAFGTGLGAVGGILRFDPLKKAYFKVGRFDPRLKRTIYQPHRNVRLLLTGAAEQQPEFASFLNQIAESVPGARVQNVRVKRLEKVRAKIRVGRPPETLSDYLGGRIIVDRAEDIPTIVRSLDDAVPRVGPNENMVVLDKHGYRSYHAQVRLPNGMSAEVQVHVPEMAAVIDEVHVLYDPFKHKFLDPVARQGLESKVRTVLDNAWEKYLQRVGPTRVVPGAEVPTSILSEPAKVTQTAFTNTLEKGGVTISVQGKVPVSGYVVSPYKAREVQIPKPLVTVETINRYRNANIDLLGNEHHYLGLWDDGSVVYLDVSITHPNQQAALAIGEQYNQEAIWDVAGNTELFTPFGQARRAAKEAGRSLPIRSEGGVHGAIRGPGEPGPPSPPEAAVPHPPGGRLGTGGVVVVSQIQEPRLSVPATEEITAAAARLIARDPADPIATEQVPRLFRRISQALRDGRIAAEDIPALRDAGLGTTEAADLFEQAGTFSGQTLNRLSQVARQINAVAPELAKELDAQAKVPLTVWARLAAAPRKTVNLWRASLVSQLATAVRNFAVFHQRYLFKAIEDASNGAYESVVKTQIPKRAFGPFLEDLMAYGRALKPGNRQRVLGLLQSVDPLLKEKLWMTPVSDVTVTGRYAKLIGTFNNAQEYFSRAMVADAVVAGELRRVGGTTLTLPMARKAVERALDMTFAKYPTSKFGREFVKAWNNPILNVLTYPFPRYLTNAVRAIWEHSPAGALKLLHPKYHSILASGDPRAAVEIATRAGIGSALFAAASWIRNSQFAGEKWYEVRVGDKTIDARPYGPLLPIYLFLAQAVKDPSQFKLRDWVEGTLGINRMAGTTLFITSVLAGENPDTLKRKLAEFSGQFLGGFTVPLRTFQDFVAQFDPDEGIVRETREAPVVGPAMANIPGVSKQLPPKPALTRGGSIRREYPALRQMTGLTVRTKNFLERELDRVGLKFFELAPRTGNVTINNLITRRIGFAADRLGRLLERSPVYPRLSDEDQREVLSEAYRQLRKASKSAVTSQEAPAVAGVIQRQLQRKSLEQRRKLLESSKRKGLLSPQVRQSLR